MKKIASIIFAFVIAATAFADDGGAIKPEDWTYGNIYVKEPNDKIALEKELMIVEQTGTWYSDETKSEKVHGNEVTAIFGFKNTTPQKVVVPCAFPVVVTTQVVLNSDGSLSNYINTGNGFSSDINLLSFAMGKKLEINSNDYSYNLNTDKNEFFTLDKKLRTLSINQYLSELKKYNTEYGELNPCQIIQDGKPVQIQTVGIETSIDKHSEYTEDLQYYNSYYRSENTDSEVYTLKMVLHFYHELIFEPSASSVLNVHYSIYTEKRNYRSINYNFYYDISTGGTWKGNIKSFVIITDSGITFENSEQRFESSDLGELGNSYSTYIYATENYKPQKDEYFIFNTTDMFQESNLYLPNNDGPQDFVTNIKASSTLPGTYKMACDNSGDWANMDNNLIDSNYSAKTSFDGNLLNGWVEGAKGDGIGEWIEFTLTKNAIGPFATNGLRRFGGSKDYENMQFDKGNYDYPDYSIYNKTGALDGTWKANNRIESMTLSNSAGKKISTLYFANTFPELYNAKYTWLAINSIVNPMVLGKGTYRMTIESVYKGEKWDDTVLGEVWFIPVENLAAKIIMQDKFFSTPLNNFIKKCLSVYHFVE